MLSHSLSERRNNPSRNERESPAVGMASSSSSSSSAAAAAALKRHPLHNFQLHDLKWAMNHTNNLRLLKFADTVQKSPRRSETDSDSDVIRKRMAVREAPLNDGAGSYGSSLDHKAGKPVRKIIIGSGSGVLVAPEKKAFNGSGVSVASEKKVTPEKRVINGFGVSFTPKKAINGSGISVTSHKKVINGSGVSFNSEKRAINGSGASVTPEKKITSEKKVINGPGVSFNSEKRVIKGSGVSVTSGKKVTPEKKVIDGSGASFLSEKKVIIGSGASFPSEKKVIIGSGASFPSEKKVIIGSGASEKNVINSSGVSFALEKKDINGSGASAASEKKNINGSGVSVVSEKKDISGPGVSVTQSTEGKSKIYIRLRTQSQKPVVEVPATGDQSLNVEYIEEFIPKTWNLRPRKPIPQSQNQNGGGPKTVALSQDNKAKKPESSRSTNTTAKKPKFSISLTREEIEDDIFAMIGSKLTRRPKKRAKNVQKQLDCLFPGMWLSSITPETYKVPDPPLKG